MTRRSILEILGKIILILLGILPALLGAELMARWLGPPFEKGGNIGQIMECDRELGWRGIPHGETTNQSDETYHLAWNSLGMHDGEHEFEKEKDVFRVLMLGDSFVQAVDVPEDKTSHQQLENILNERVPDNIRVEVIAGGILSWGPSQALMFFRTTGKRFKPDLVIGLWFPSAKASE